MGPAVRLVVYLHFIAGDTFLLVCVVTFPYLWDLNLFEMVLTPLGATCTLSGLWYRSVCTLAKNVLEAGNQKHRQRQDMQYSAGGCSLGQEICSTRADTGLWRG